MRTITYVYHASQPPVFTFVDFGLFVRYSRVIDNTLGLSIGPAYGQ